MTNDERFSVIEAGFTGDIDTARAGLSHNLPAVRASALRALARLQVLEHSEIASGVSDTDPEVRRTAAELAVTSTDVSIHHLLNDDDVFVAEMTAWCLGERVPITDDEIEALVFNTTEHAEPVVREACAAALGSLGDIRGLPAIIAACTDKPAVRRRAILALAPFDGDEVEAVLARALEDTDWQVRQNAEILINPRD
jgi:HEAT repeat protein